MMKCPEQPALACPFDANGASARPVVAFSGFYESHEPSPSGDAFIIVPPHCNDRQTVSKWVYFA